MGRPRNDCVKLYFEQFNNEVDEFFNADFQVDYELRASRIHVDSKIKYLEREEAKKGITPDVEDDDDDEAKNKKPIPLGVHWSSREKRLFFHYLSRYSIHRLDEWYRKVGSGSKSKYEVLTYYRVLRSNLHAIKRRNTIDKRKKGLFAGILRRKDLPIAYEMSESFVQLEETMAASLPTGIDAVYSETPSDETQLITLQPWERRWHSVLRRSPTVSTQQSALPVSVEAYDYLTRLAKRHLRQVIYSTVLPQLERKAIAVRDKDDDNSDKLHTVHLVTRRDVLTGIHRLRLMLRDTKRVPLLAETWLQSLSKFELQISESKNKSNLSGSIIRNSRTLNDLVECFTREVPFLEPLPLLRKGADSAVTEPIVDGTIAAEEEMALCQWETLEMEQEDMRRSRRYCNALLQRFTRSQTPISIAVQQDEPLPGAPARSKAALNRFLYS